jgi:RNA polymerase sigma-70 factor (ECF subfamily)
VMTNPPPAWTDHPRRVFIRVVEAGMGQAETTWTGAGHAVPVEDSFEEFFELEQERLLRMLWMVTGSLQEAEDIVQEAFLRVWERWPRVSTMDSPTGYLHHAAMNIFRNRYRRAKLGLRKAIGSDPPIDAFGSAEDRISVSNALRSLTPKQRAALVLTDLLGYPAAEAGRMLGVRGSTVRSLSSTARAALRDAKELTDE